ncbi:hypothetical protein BJ742DRAFT_537703 [Cladochytrium replicatum]|nr:hypothetical protein BJ742DRAFT_537703 [Cladochytrium replicatum]
MDPSATTTPPNAVPSSSVGIRSSSVSVSSSSGKDSFTVAGQRRDPRVSSCDSCYRAKTKCDGAFPCEKCVKRGKTCSYDRVQHPDSFKRNPRTSVKKATAPTYASPSSSTSSVGQTQTVQSSTQNISLSSTSASSSAPSPYFGDDRSQRTLFHQGHQASQQPYQRSDYEYAAEDYRYNHDISAAHQRASYAVSHPHLFDYGSPVTPHRSSDSLDYDRQWTHPGGGHAQMYPPQPGPPPYHPQRHEQQMRYDGLAQRQESSYQRSMPSHYADESHRMVYPEPSRSSFVIQPHHFSQPPHTSELETSSTPRVPSQVAPTLASETQGTVVDVNEVNRILKSSSIVCSPRLARRVAQMVALRLHKTPQPYDVSDSAVARPQASAGLRTHLVAVYFAYVHPFLPRLIDPTVFLPRFSDFASRAPHYDALVAAMCANACRFSAHHSLVGFQGGKDEDGLLKFAGVFADEAAEWVERVEREGMIGVPEERIVRIQTLVLLSWWGTWGLKGEKMNQYLSRALREVQLLQMNSKEWSEVINGPPHAADAYRVQLRRMLPTLLTFDYQTSMFAGMLCNMNEMDNVEEVLKVDEQHHQRGRAGGRPATENDLKAIFSVPSPPFDAIWKEEKVEEKVERDRDGRAVQKCGGGDYYDALVAANGSIWDEDGVQGRVGAQRSEAAVWFEMLVEHAAPSLYAEIVDGTGVTGKCVSKAKWGWYGGAERNGDGIADVVRQEYQLFQMLCHLLVPDANHGSRASDSDFFFQMTLVTRRVYRTFNTESRLLQNLTEVPLLSPIARTIAPPLDVRTLQTAMTDWYCSLPAHLRAFPSLAVFSDNSNGLGNPYVVASQESWPRDPIAVKIAGYYLSATAKIHRVRLLSGKAGEEELFAVSHGRVGVLLPSVEILRATHKALVYVLTCVYAAHGYCVPNVFEPNVRGLDPETGLAYAKWRCGECRSSVGGGWDVDVGGEGLMQTEKLHVDLPEGAFMVDGQGGELQGGLQRRIPPFSPFTMRMKFGAFGVPGGGEGGSRSGGTPAQVVSGGGGGGRGMMDIRHLAASAPGQDCTCGYADDSEPAVAPWPFLETMWTSGAIFDITHYALASTLRTALEDERTRQAWESLCRERNPDGSAGAAIPVQGDSALRDVSFIVFSTTYLILPTMMQVSQVWSITSVAGQFLREAMKFALSGKDIGGMAHQNR